MDEARIALTMRDVKPSVQHNPGFITWNCLNYAGCKVSSLTHYTLHVLGIALTMRDVKSYFRWENEENGHGIALTMRDVKGFLGLILML